jgi:hypothetical protein
MTPSSSTADASWRPSADEATQTPNSRGRPQPIANITRPSLKTAGPAKCPGVESLSIRQDPLFQKGFSLTCRTLADVGGRAQMTT